MVDFSQETNPTRFLSPHFVYAPLHDGRELVVLSGIVRIGFVPKGSLNVTRETFGLGISLDAVFRAAGRNPDTTGLQLRHWAPLVTPVSMKDSSEERGSQHTIERFSIRDPGPPKQVIWIDAVLVVARRLATLDRLGYNVTLIGSFVRVDPPPIP